MKKLLKKHQKAFNKKKKEKLLKKIGDINDKLDFKPIIQLYKSSSKEVTENFRIDAFPFPKYDLEEFLKLCSDAIFEQINKDLAKHKGLKIKLMAQVEMVRTDIKTGEEVFSKPYFHSKMKCVYPT